MMKKSVSMVWSIFLRGFLTILPIAITFGIFSFILKFFKNVLSPITKIHIPILDVCIKKIPHGEFLLVLLIIFLSGMFLQSFVIRSFLKIIETLITQLPVVRPVYVGIKQLVHAFSPSDHKTFKQVVLIEFPRPGIYAIGFVTNELAADLSPNAERKFYSVFLPHTPNPTTGFYLIVPIEQVYPGNMSTQEAMSLIISGGIIQPKKSD